MDEVAKRATPSRPDLRERVRAWLAQGRLPAIDATAWAGPGTGERCAVCRGVVETGQEISRDGAPLFAHRDCYAIWRDESRPLPRGGGGQ